MVAIKELGNLLLHPNPPPKKKIKKRKKKHINGRIFHVALHHLLSEVDNLIATFSLIFSEMFFFPCFLFFLICWSPTDNICLNFSPQICSLAMVTKMFRGWSTVQCQFSIMCATIS